MLLNANLFRNFRKVVFPVPAFLVRKIDLHVYLTYLSAVSKIASFSISSPVFGKDKQISNRSCPSIIAIQQLFMYICQTTTHYNTNTSILYL